MQDKELYQQVLGLASPWVVGRVELNVAEQCVDVFVEHDSRVKWRCRSAIENWGVTITPRSGHGGISTLASS